MGYSHDHVARLNAARHDGEAQRVGAAADRYRMAGAAKGSECFFEFFHHGTADEAGGVQNLMKDGCEFLLHFYVRRDQIKKRNAV